MCGLLGLAGLAGCFAGGLTFGGLCGFPAWRPNACLRLHPYIDPAYYLLPNLHLLLNHTFGFVAIPA